MKLLIILLCLLSERYLVHAVSHLRFNWFPSYFAKISQTCSQIKWLQNPLLMLIIVVLPLIVITGLVLLLADHLIFGFICFLINLIIFYYCLGPVNPFYPLRERLENEEGEIAAGNYFAQVNGQLFSVVFWYVTTGVIGVLIYRLISLCREEKITASLAATITAYLDWIPARITVLLFLIVGNFQKGFRFYTQRFLSWPEGNDYFLSEGGLLAARTSENEIVQLPYAENLVEHAMIVYLVFLALFTLVALL